MQAKNNLVFRLLLVALKQFIDMLDLRRIKQKLIGHITSAEKAA